MSICRNRPKQRWRGPSRASADVFFAVPVLFEDAADFVELAAEFGAQAGQNRDERDCDQRSDQRVFDSGGARLVADERLEGLDHFLLLRQKWSSIWLCIVRRLEWGQITGSPVSPKLIRSGEARRFEEAFPLG